LRSSIVTGEALLMCRAGVSGRLAYDAIRQRLARCIEDPNLLSANDKLLIESLHQLTIVLESDFTQIKVALGHVARLLESRSGLPYLPLGGPSKAAPPIATASASHGQWIMIVPRCVSQQGARA